MAENAFYSSPVTSNSTYRSHHSYLAPSPRATTQITLDPMLPRKRDRSVIKDSDDNTLFNSKKYVSEEMMARRMQQLRLSTLACTSHPLAHSPPTIDPPTLAGDVPILLDSNEPETETESSNDVCDTEMLLLDGNRGDTGNCVDMKDDNEENRELNVWIAPEMQEIIKRKTNKLLPTIQPLNHCTAIVPYIKPSDHILQTIWKSKVNDAILSSSDGNDEEVDSVTSDELWDYEDEMEL